MQQIYDISRDPEVCLSQVCSFPRHGPDMGFTLHTLCDQKSCLNYDTCQNNIDSLQWINNNNLNILEIPHKGYGLFAGQEGYGIGDFICTYSGEVSVTPSNPDKAKKSRYVMQFADRYVIEATSSASAGKFINHGCPGAANARTQIMITPTDIYMGIVAKRVIAPEEEIVLDYCGACQMPPSLRNASLATFGIEHCHCDTCIKTSVGPSDKVHRPQRAKPATQSSQSSTTSSQPSQPSTRFPPAHMSQPETQTQYSVVQQGSPGVDWIPAPETKGRARSSSASSSSTTTLGQRPKTQTDSSGSSYTRKSTKTPRNNERPETSPTPEDNRKAMRESVHAIGTQGDTHRTERIQSQVGKPRREGETILMPLVCLLSAQVAQKTHPDIFAAAKRIVLKLTVAQSHVHSFMKLIPVGFNMQTNLVGCAAAFLPKAIRNLQPWETTLGPGVIGRLAQRYNILNLGDQIYDLLLTTQLFKCKAGHEGANMRDLDTFPLVANAQTTPQGTQITYARAPTNKSPPSISSNNPSSAPATPNTIPPADNTQTTAQGIQATYAQALTRKPSPSISSNTPTSAPVTPSSILVRDSPSSTVSSLSGASTSTTARSALLEIIRAPHGNRPSPQAASAHDPPPVWQTAMANTMQMLTELLSRFPPPQHPPTPSQTTTGLLLN